MEYRYYEAPWGNGWGCFAHRILPRFDLCHPTRLLDMFPLRQNASKTPKWVRSGAVAGDAQHCSRHDVDPGRGSGSLREASVGSSSVPLVCSLPFGAPMPRRHGSSTILGCVNNRIAPVHKDKPKAYTVVITYLVLLIQLTDRYSASYWVL